GVEFEANTGQSAHGDGSRSDFSLTVGGGFAEDKGHMVLNIGYTRQDPVYQGERAYSRFSLAGSDFSPGGSATNAAGALQSVLNEAGQRVMHTFDSNGDLVPYDPALHSFNFNPYNLLQAPEDRWTATLLGSYRVN